jgi:hypothetical protein
MEQQRMMADPNMRLLMAMAHHAPGQPPGQPGQPGIPPPGQPAAPQPGMVQ